MGERMYRPHFLDLGTSWRWVVSFMVGWIRGWVDHRAGLDEMEKWKFLTLRGLEIQPLGRRTYSRSLYRLHYPGSYLFFWGTLSHERTGLSFIYAAGPCQRSLSQVRVPWDSRPYFTVSDLRFPFSSPPTIRRVTHGGGIRPRLHEVCSHSRSLSYPFGTDPAENTASIVVRLVHPYIA
jgi:hypothetical protein